MPNQMLALMHLAWDRCKGDINTVLSFIIGAAAFFAVFAFYVVLNLNANHGSTLQLQLVSPEAAMVAGAYWASLIHGVVNTVSILLFLAILVCLLEYTGNFVIVCWYYDDCSWEVPKLIKRFLQGINRHFARVRKANAIEAEKSRNSLTTSVKSIKKSEDL